MNRQGIEAAESLEGSPSDVTKKNLPSCSMAYAQTKTTEEACKVRLSWVIVLMVETWSDLVFSYIALPCLATPCNRIHLPKEMYAYLTTCSFNYGIFLYLLWLSKMLQRTKRKEVLGKILNKRVSRFYKNKLN